MHLLAITPVANHSDGGGSAATIRSNDLTSQVFRPRLAARKNRNQPLIACIDPFFPNNGNIKNSVSNLISIGIIHRRTLLDQANEEEMLQQDMKSITILLNQAQTGCDESRDRVFELVHPYVERLATRYADIKIRQKAGVSDIVQRSYVKLVENFENVRANSGVKFRAWLKIVVKNEANQLSRGYGTQRRDISREQSADEQGGIAGSINAVRPTPGTEAIRKEQFENVKKAMSRLSEDYQTVIRLRNFEDKNDEEIVLLMGRSKAAVNKLWFRAIKRLQEVMLVNEEQ